MQRITVSVKPDFLERLTHVKKPVLAISELIWNGLDADATTVDVSFHRSLLNTLDRIEVQDNGTGMSHDLALKAFKSLGGSWKKGKRSKREKRLLHGKAGKGRYRAFGLGNVVTWTSTYAASKSEAKTFYVRGYRDRLSEFEISDPTEGDPAHIGTRVEVTEISGSLPSLLSAHVRQELAEQFAIYLRKYRTATIAYNGALVDPLSLVTRTSEYDLTGISSDDGSEIPAQLEVVEWSVQTERDLFLCDSDGFALQRLPAGIQAPGHNFSAYLKSNHFRVADLAGLLDLEELAPATFDLIKAGRTRLRSHFRERAAELAGDLVDSWKRQQVYPYEGNATSPIDEVRRQVFDVVALNVHEYLPGFADSEVATQRFSMRLLREAIEESPETLRRILGEVLNLPQGKRDELASLLESTTLSAVIAASKLVGDRLSFLRALELMIYDPETSKVVKERLHLQKILEHETWIFGEEFNLSVADRSLNEVLRKHLRILGRDTLEADISTPVLREDGTQGIIDLMLSRSIPQPNPATHEHLVVELKRPTQQINSAALQQIQSYAFAVAGDERFSGVDTKWHFWAVSTTISDDVQRQAVQRNRPAGLVHEDDSIQIWVRPWSEVINDAKARLRFFEEKLEFEATDDTAVAFLREQHSKHLPPQLLATESTGTSHVDDRDPELP